MDGEHHDAYAWLFVILLLIGGAGAYLGVSPMGDQASTTNTVTAENTQDNKGDGKGGLSWKSLFPKGSFEKGKRVIMLDEVSVRRSPGGSILGEQDKRERATIIEGPVSAFGSQWWNLDFKNAPDGWVNQESISAFVFFYMLLSIIPILYGNIIWLGVVLSLLFALMLLWIFIKNKALQKSLKERKSVRYTIEEQKNIAKMEATPVVNKKWVHVQSLMESQNNNDWRQAIIESDIMLDEMLTKIGYAGQSIGEKLKNVEESDFFTLNDAWEAHKVRNRIAHKGSDFVISHSEAMRVIGLYENVFREFYYV